MAGLALDGSNPDVSLLYDINGLAKAAPTWFDRVMEFVGEFGIMFGMVLAVLWCWWSVRRRGTTEDSVTAVAGLVWAPLAAGIALLINIPIRGFVERPRPFFDHKGLEVLVAGKTDFSFVSDHATMAMAIAVGLFVANRKFGLVAIGLALLEGFCRVYMGVHYPTDVIGGFALGTAVALLLAPLAMMLLTPLVGAVARAGTVGRLVRSRTVVASADGRGDAQGIPEPSPGSGRGGSPGERDLAA
ncbi:phosphatase PAP2 family protein [Streptomyces sp. ME02-6979-3A]|uniref:Phosphatase PAP2 family protein n=1 Tax=Streptomyces silvae TaxID=2803812 RepID=A0ABU8A4N1_9ACTN|nr:MULTISPECIES: phosphatase PAP2 family protein [unclassified Streptomyces]WSS63295.1 phosphatase PAP2 family protein [Streptomyces sp. NBC_01177]WSS70290.1 phosphatase PAP2 family protein [Streptomyces sp. NBC_01175]WSS77289.1 phosphatase PAP2 family protein [Streptomyces sp. NBC_01174]MDX3327119.1 phosphatase PAP2 family protein [Streptomyces sp. ME02-6979-3A]MDX3682005.1 phosphatase PAP2 family protein [Streptomyces sp. AK04-4c]